MEIVLAPTSKEKYTIWLGLEGPMGGQGKQCTLYSKYKCSLGEIVF